MGEFKLNSLLEKLLQLQGLPTTTQNNFYKKLNHKLIEIENSLEYFLEGFYAAHGTQKLQEQQNHWEIQAAGKFQNKTAYLSDYNNESEKEDFASKLLKQMKNECASLYNINGSIDDNADDDKLQVYNKSNSPTLFDDKCSKNAVLTQHELIPSKNNYCETDKYVANTTNFDKKGKAQVLVKDSEMKIVRAAGGFQQQLLDYQNEYDIELMIPDVNTENLSVECGDYEVRVSLDLRNRMCNKNKEIYNKEDGLLQKFCIVLPEIIQRQATAAEICLPGKLKIKCITTR